MVSMCIYWYSTVRVTFYYFQGTLKLNSNYYGSSEILATVDAEDIDDFERTESLGGFEYDG